MKPTKITPYEFTLRFDNSPTIRYVVNELSYARNGVTGSGYFVLRFRNNEDKGPALIGIVFDSESDKSMVGAVAIINSTDLSDHYRGDVFAQPLRDCIKARKGELWPHVREAMSR